MLHVREGWDYNTIKDFLLQIASFVSRVFLKIVTSFGKCDILLDEHLAP